MASFAMLSLCSSENFAIAHHCKLIIPNQCLLLDVVWRIGIFLLQGLNHGAGVLSRCYLTSCKVISNLGVELPASCFVNIDTEAN